MTATMEQPTTDQVMAFATRVGEELAAASSVALAVLGDRLGLYRTLADAGDLTPAELAARSGCAERYVREWLANQAAGGWIAYDPATGRFSLPAAHAAVLADEGSPAFLLGSAQVTAAVFAGLDRLTKAFRSGEGIAWDDHDADLHEGAARFFQTASGPYLLSWVEALDDVAQRLRSGGRIADIGCGRGAATVLLARSFPAAQVVGVDSSADSLDAARRAAADAGVAVAFEHEQAERWRGSDVDLVCLLDALHDAGDPVAVARAARQSLADDGALLVVEPMAGDDLADNLTWVGRAYYATSTAFCTPSALAQEGSWALGNQVGPARLEHVLRQAGFRDVRHVAATPFQLVLEARP